MYKVGDYIQYRYSRGEEYNIGKIEQIEQGKLWCHWSIISSIKRYPKTIVECDRLINYNNMTTFVIIERDKDRIEILNFNINKRIS